MPTLMMRPELHHPDLFLLVAEARTFAGAARIISRTQPAISQAIARLEEIYGDLFERRRGALLELTPIGQSILPSARMILDTVAPSELSHRTLRRRDCLDHLLIASL